MEGDPLGGEALVAAYTMRLSTAPVFPSGLNLELDSFLY